MFYITTQPTLFIYGYMVSDIWLRTTLISRKETRHMDYSFWLAARVLLYASSHRQDNTYHGLCYTSRGALAGTRNSSMGSPWRIDPTTHRTMSERSYHGATCISIETKFVTMNIIGHWRWLIFDQPRIKRMLSPLCSVCTTPNTIPMTTIVAHIIKK